MTLLCQPEPGEDELIYIKNNILTHVFENYRFLAKKISPPLVGGGLIN